MAKKTITPDSVQFIADHRGANNGVLHRRAFLKKTLWTSAAVSSTAMADLSTPSSWQQPGSGFSNYGIREQDPSKPIRWMTAMPAVQGNGVSWTPLHNLAGTITPTGLHFERHHNGVPTINGDTWQVVVHGLVDKALSFDLNALHRYPLISKICFIECGGNSNSSWYPQPVQAQAGYIHGLVSCAEWTGIALATLLDEAGVRADAKWLIVDGLDSSGVSVSIPLDKVRDDAMLALYQNGEAVRPEHGFPARLVLPGWEGITNVKWVRSLRVSDKPLMSRFDTVAYTDLTRDGKALRFTREMGVKSLITSPSPGLEMQGPGFYEIRGLAWTGAGRIKRVEVSADGGQTWADAQIQEPVIDKSLTRFRAPWVWDGTPATLVSRATDETNQVQPDRESLLQQRGMNMYYHFNALIAWSVSDSGAVRHVYL